MALYNAVDNFHLKPNFGDCDCGGPSFKDRAEKNFVDTNKAVKGLVAPAGSSALGGLASDGRLFGSKGALEILRTRAFLAEGPLA